LRVGIVFSMDHGTFESLGRALLEICVHNVGQFDSSLDQQLK
jgi:hypothetical protein